MATAQDLQARGITLTPITKPLGQSGVDVLKARGITLTPKSNTQTQPASSPGLLGSAAGVATRMLGTTFGFPLAGTDLGTGIAKGVGSTLKSLGTIGQFIGNQTGGRVANALSGKGFSSTGPAFPTPQSQSQGDIYSPGTPAAQAADAALRPKGALQTVGYFGEKTGEFFLPAGAVSKGQAAIDAAITGTGFAPAAARVLSKAALEGGTAGAVSFAQTANPAIAGLTALTAGLIKTGTGALGETAKATNLPERIYSTVFKNTFYDMKQELTTQGIANLQKSDPALFKQLSDAGVIKLGADGAPILDETLAKEALDRGLSGNLRNMANTTVAGYLKNEMQAQTIAANSKAVVSVPNANKLAAVLDDVAARYGNVGNGELSTQARSYAEALRRGVAPAAETNPARLLSSGGRPPLPNTIPLPSKFSAATDYVGKPLLPPVSTALGKAPVGSPNAGTLDAKTLLGLRRFLDSMRRASSYDTNAPLAQTQANFKYWSDLLRGKLATDVPGMASVMKDYSFNLEALDSLAGEAKRLGNNQVLSLIDSILLGEGVGGTHPGVGGAMFLARKLFTLPGVRTTAAQAIQKSGNLTPLGAGAKALGGATMTTLAQ